MRRMLSLLSAVVACAVCCAAQQRTDLAEIASHAGIIFRGTVLAVATENPHAPGEIGLTRVTFHVDDGVRGTATGEILTIRQWNAGNDEYRVGESLVLFLYAPSAELGLTSAVGGRRGHLQPENTSTEELDTFRDATKSAPSVPSPPPSVPTRPARRSAR